jgi:hypothetical protein
LVHFLAPAGKVQPRNLRTHKNSIATRRLRHHAASTPTYTVTATVYEAVPSQTDDEPFVTADNSRIKPHYSSRQRWMALSRDLLKQWGGAFNYGDRVRVRGISPALDGVYTVHDTMNRRHRHCMDVLVHPKEKLDIFTKGVKISLVEAATPLLARAKAAQPRPGSMAASNQRVRPRPQWAVPAGITPWKMERYPATAFQLLPR